MLDDTLERVLRRVGLTRMNELDMPRSVLIILCRAPGTIVAGCPGRRLGETKVTGPDWSNLFMLVGERDGRVSVTVGDDELFS